MVSKYTFALLFLEILFNCPFVLLSADLPVLFAEFDYKLAIKKANEFYKTLPKNIILEATMLVPELISTHGYPCETHKVTTSDGYILTMHRIPYGQSKTENRPVVYLQHGFLSSSADWVVPGPEKGFGYLLADAGYDVWMPNVRGNSYSRNHINLDPDDKEFWNFSWHEIGLYDVTAMIDYTLNKTKQEKLYYIGHSQGNTIFYVMCSEKFEYNLKIHAQFSLAPLAYMSHMRSRLLHTISAASNGSEMLLLSVADVKEFLPKKTFLANIGTLLCTDNSVTQVLCTNALFAVCGFNPKQINTTLLPSIMEHTPGGCSVKQLLHYTQLINSGEFRQLDYGSPGNKRHYGTILPPEYSLRKVTSPVYLYYSMDDWLSDERDVLKLASELGNVRAKILIEDANFSHVDYLYGINARKLVYDDIITRMKKQ